MREERQLALPMMFDTPTATSIVIIESHGILRECLRALTDAQARIAQHRERHAVRGTQRSGAGPARRAATRRSTSRGAADGCHGHATLRALVKCLDDSGLPSEQIARTVNGAGADRLRASTLKPSTPVA
jgi:hypothetical protein